VGRCSVLGVVGVVLKSEDEEGDEMVRVTRARVEECWSW